MVRRVLVLNAGSSSLKASVLDGDAIAPVAEARANLTDPRDEAVALRQVLKALANGGAEPKSYEAVGHRIVHGGTRLTGPTLVDEAAISTIEALRNLAPLHNPAALATLAAARDALRGVPHIACFDTAFHRALDPASVIYALPYAWYADWGYRRFGFHGLSVAWAVERSGELLAQPPRDLGLLIAHLGAGCSVTAVWQGSSVATSMGMTPLEGLAMATRAGSIDPGVLLAAMREHDLSVSALEEILESRSGLLGISGRSGDMRELLEDEERNPRASLAIEIFVRSAAAGIAAAATALPRLDAIAFTGGIGERAAGVRARIVSRLASIGVPPIAAETSQVDAVLALRPLAVLRITAREDVVIAREVRSVLGGDPRRAR